MLSLKAWLPRRKKSPQTRRSRLSLFAAILFALTPVLAWGQAAVLQGGSWTAGHGLKYSANGNSSQPIVVDAGAFNTLPNYTVATLPTCNSSIIYTMAVVTDATSPTYNGALTGSGSTVVPVFCNGSAWTSH